jgi:type IV secretory pathway VirB2 component (pilin)
MKKIVWGLKLFAINLFYAAPLLAGYNIESAGTTNASILRRVVEFMQDIVDAVDGPLAIFAVIVGAIAALCLWIFAPDNRHLNKACKVVAAGIGMFEIGALITYMRG